MKHGLLCAWSRHQHKCKYIGREVSPSVATNSLVQKDHNKNNSKKISFLLTIIKHHIKTT